MRTAIARLLERGFSDGEVRKLASVGLDVTDRQRAEQALRASESRHRALVDNAPFLFWAESTFTLEPMGIAVPLDQPQLANLIRAYFTSLSETRGLDEAKDFWFRDPSWVGNLR